MEAKTQIFSTSDIALASYLHCSGVYLSGIDRQNLRRCVFIFDSPNPELISKWQEGRATVNALAYHNSYQSLKAKMFRGEA